MPALKWNMRACDGRGLLDSDGTWSCEVDVNSLRGGTSTAGAKHCGTHNGTPDGTLMDKLGPEIIH